MDKYFYLVAQLPSLAFDREMPISIEAFLEEAAKWLPNREMRLLSAARVDQDEAVGPTHPVYARYRHFESRLRREIGLFRQAIREGGDFRPETFPLSLVKEGNPLEVEKRLLARRWEVIDEEEREHHFDLGFLILYYLKLQILQKLSIFNKEKGLERFHSLIKEMA